MSVSVKGLRVSHRVQVLVLFSPTTLSSLRFIRIIDRYTHSLAFRIARC